jgi:putative transposase
MAKFFRKDALMTTAVAPFPSVSSRGQLRARHRACLGQIVRRQTSPQRLGRRAKILLALATGANQCHVLRQMHRKRGTGQGWGRRWCALAPTLAQREAEEGSDQARTTVIVEALTAAPRSGTPATLTPEHIVQMVAVACAAPMDAGRPVSHWTPREVAEAVRTRRMVETSSTRSVGRFLTSGGLAASSGRGLAQRPAGCPRRLYRPSGGRVCRVSAGASRGSGRRPGHQDG